MREKYDKYRETVPKEFLYPGYVEDYDLETIYAMFEKSNWPEAVLSEDFYNCVENKMAMRALCPKFAAHFGYKKFINTRSKDGRWYTKKGWVTIYVNSNKEFSIESTIRLLGAKYKRKGAISHGEIKI